MTSHRTPQQTNPVIIGLLVCMIPIMILFAVVFQARSTNDQPTSTVVPSITADSATLSYEAPTVAATQLPELDGSPIPPCAADSVGPGTAPCYWDSGQFGGPESYIWTGQRKIQLVEPRP